MNFYVLGFSVTTITIGLFLAFTHNFFIKRQFLKLTEEIVTKRKLNSYMLKDRGTLHVLNGSNVEYSIRTDNILIIWCPSGAFKALYIKIKKKSCLYNFDVRFNKNTKENIAYSNIKNSEILL